MSFAALAIERKVISWMFALFLLIGGTVAYFGLGQLEDPEFTLKKAMVITLYPGASPQQQYHHLSGRGRVPRPRARPIRATTAAPTLA